NLHRYANEVAIKPPDPGRLANLLQQNETSHTNTNTHTYDVSSPHTARHVDIAPHTHTHTHTHTDTHTHPHTHTHTHNHTNIHTHLIHFLFPHAPSPTAPVLQANVCSE